MPGDETREHHSDEFDSEAEEEEEVLPFVEVDVTTLTALSPEVISKQVRSLPAAGRFEMVADCSWWDRPRLTWVCMLRVCCLDRPISRLTR